MSKKVLAILVHQEAAKLPAIKVFVASKSSVLCSKWPDYGAKKDFNGWSFCSPLMHKDDWYFFGTFQPHINWFEKGKKFAVLIMSARYSRKIFVYTLIHLIKNARGAVFIRYLCISVPYVSIIQGMENSKSPFKIEIPCNKW